MKGAITDKTGNVHNGPNAVLKERAHGVTTDFDRNFILGVLSNGTLIFSSIGIKLIEITVVGKTGIDITIGRSRYAI